jgi:hypothetical protein
MAQGTSTTTDLVAARIQFPGFRPGRRAVKADGRRPPRPPARPAVVGVAVPGLVKPVDYRPM